MVPATAFSLELFWYFWLLENVIPEISIALASARAISDIFRGMLGMHIDSEVKDAIIQAQNATLQSQDQMSGILVKFEEQLAENAESKEKLASIQRWDETKAKYEIVELYEGRHAYKLRSPSGEIEPCEHRRKDRINPPV